MSKWHSGTRLFTKLWQNRNNSRNIGSMSCDYIGHGISRAHRVETIPADFMMISSNGIIFRVTGNLCGEFTGHRWIPLIKDNDEELRYFLSSATRLRLVIWDAIAPIMMSLWCSWLYTTGGKYLACKLPYNCGLFFLQRLTGTIAHWGRVTHLCVRKIIIIGSVNALSAPSHYLNQCCNIVNWTLGNKLQLNFSWNQ